MKPLIKCKCLLCLLLLNFVVTTVFAQDILFPGVSARGETILAHPDGSLLIAGQIRTGADNPWQMAVWRVDRSGRILDQNLYGDSLQDAANCAILTDDGGYLVAGNGFAAEKGIGREDIKLFKFNAMHQLEWTRIHGMQFMDVPFAVEQLVDGYIVAGYTRSNAKHGDPLLMRVDEDGMLMWRHSYEMPHTDFGYDVEPLENGGFLLLVTQAGVHFPSRSNHHAAHSDILLIETDGMGEEVRRVNIGGKRHDFAREIVRAEDGGFFIVGSSQNNSAGSFDISLWKLDKNLNQEWRKCYGGKDFEYGETIIPDDNGRWLILGSQKEPNTDVDAVLISIDKDGNAAWEMSMGSPASEYGYAFTRTIDNDLLIHGTIKGELRDGLFISKLNRLDRMYFPSASNSPSAFWDFQLFNGRGKVVQYQEGEPGSIIELQPNRMDKGTWYYRISGGEEERKGRIIVH